eukprot:TRINITY_DN889_c0_g1_i1.p2 TRINITY_DN889_c0_g1~~TRINITY_DN889_c0_g1_i1.p2  ORF type:complete len:80 (+),score=3.94 TRINITY_DN889_c0_g1_i1:338-577(+)
MLPPQLKTTEVHVWDPCYYNGEWRRKKYLEASGNFYPTQLRRFLDYMVQKVDSSNCHSHKPTLRSSLVGAILSVSYDLR